MSEMEIFSDPVAGLVGAGGILPGEQVREIVRYDEELVKPAVLLADTITLTTQREDLILEARRDARMTQFRLHFWAS